MELDESHGDHGGKEFKILYKVKDKAKNEATPQDRIVEIKEVSMFDLKQLIQQKEQELEKEKSKKASTKSCQSCPVCKETTCPKEVVKVTRVPPTEKECENLLLSRNYTVLHEGEQGSCVKTSTPETTTSRQLASGRSEHTATPTTPLPIQTSEGSLEGAWFYFVIFFVFAVVFLMFRLGVWNNKQGGEAENVALTGYAPRTPVARNPNTPTPMRHDATLRQNPYRTT